MTIRKHNRSLTDLSQYENIVIAVRDFARFRETRRRTKHRAYESRETFVSWTHASSTPYSNKVRTAVYTTHRDDSPCDASFPPTPPLDGVASPNPSRAVATDTVAQLVVTHWRRASRRATSRELREAANERTADKRAHGRTNEGTDECADDTREFARAFSLAPFHLLTRNAAGVARSGDCASLSLSARFCLASAPYTEIRYRYGPRAVMH